MGANLYLIQDIQNLNEKYARITKGTQEIFSTIQNKFLPNPEADPQHSQCKHYEIVEEVYKSFGYYWGLISQNKIEDARKLLDKVITELELSVMETIAHYKRLISILINITNSLKNELHDLSSKLCDLSLPFSPNLLLPDINTMDYYLDEDYRDSINHYEHDVRQSYIDPLSNKIETLGKAQQYLNGNLHEYEQLWTQFISELADEIKFMRACTRRDISIELSDYRFRNLDLLEYNLPSGLLMQIGEFHLAEVEYADKDGKLIVDSFKETAAKRLLINPGRTHESFLPAPADKHIVATNDENQALNILPSSPEFNH